MLSSRSVAILTLILFMGCGKPAGYSDTEKQAFSAFQVAAISFQFDVLFGVDVDARPEDQPENKDDARQSGALIAAIRALKTSGACKKELTVSGNTTVRKLSGDNCPVVYVSEITRGIGQSVPQSGYLKIVLQSTALQALSDLIFLEVTNTSESGALNMVGTAISQSQGTITYAGKLWFTSAATEYETTFLFANFKAAVRLTMGFDGKVTGTLNGQKFSPSALTGLLQ